MPDPGTRTSLLLLTHPDCLGHVNPAGHPESPRRLAAVREHLDAALVGPGLATWGEAAPATDADLALVHDPAYLALLARLDASGGGRLDEDTTMGPGSLRAARLASGAAVAATARALAGEGPTFCAIRPPGHHATPGRAMGFCLLSTAAIAAFAAVRRHGADRVLVVDWDVHHGNGTADCVREEPRIRYVSLHQSPWYPGTGAVDDTGCGNLFHVPRPPGLEPDVYVRDLLDAVARAVAGFAPSLVIHSAGFDAMRGDPLAGFTLEPEHYVTITDGVAERAPGPALGVLEGGYEPSRLADGAAHHAAALAGARPDPRIRPAGRASA